LDKEKASQNTIEKILSILTECYPGRFQTTDKTAKIWELMLSDLDPQLAIAATIQLCSQRETWPPDVASIRRQTILMSNGLLINRHGSESWTKVICLIDGKKVDLDEIESEALKRTGKLNDLRTSTKPDADRFRFIEAFNAIYQKRLSDSLLLPLVRDFVSIQNPGSLFGAKSVLDPQKLLPPERAILSDDYQTTEPTDSEKQEIKKMVSEILERANKDDENKKKDR
jgi:hypothetical protein